LRFLTSYLKTYLELESIDHLSSSLKRTGNSDLRNFFPANRQSYQLMDEHFKNEGLGAVIEFNKYVRAARAKEDLNSKLQELVNDEEGPEEMLFTIKEQGSVLEEKELVSIIFLALVANLDLLSGQAEATGASLLKQIDHYAAVLEAHANTGVSQLELIKTIQSYFTENAQLSTTFPKLIRLLYSKDVLAKSAILYWYDKGKPNPSLASTVTPLINFLREHEEEEEEEE